MGMSGKKRTPTALRVTSGRHSKNMRSDIAEKIREQTDAFADTVEQEALIRWALNEWLERYQGEECSWDEFWVNIIGGANTLSQILQRRKETEIASHRVITPEQFFVMCTRIGAALNRISDPGERAQIAQDVAGIIRGSASNMAEPQRRLIVAQNHDAVTVIQEAIIDESG